MDGTYDSVCTGRNDMYEGKLHFYPETFRAWVDNGVNRTDTFHVDYIEPAIFIPEGTPALPEYEAFVEEYPCITRDTFVESADVRARVLADIQNSFVIAVLHRPNYRIMIHLESLVDDRIDYFVHGRRNPPMPIR